MTGVPGAQTPTGNCAVRDKLIAEVEMKLKEYNVEMLRILKEEGITKASARLKPLYETCVSAGIELEHHQREHGCWLLRLDHHGWKNMNHHSLARR
jgi:hypothetical protein